MAITGIHVVCGYPGDNVGNPQSSFPIMGEVAWSQTFTASGMSSEVAPRGSGRNPVFVVKAHNVDGYFAIDSAPNGNGTRRFSIEAGERLEVYGEGGEKIDVVVVP